MPREAAFNVQNDFIQGLITETTALRFPENACTDALNVVFDETARSCVRGAIDSETGYASATITDSTSDVFASYLWENVAGTGSSTFLVQQAGSILRFYDTSATTDVSQNIKSFTVDLDTYKTDTGFDLTLSPCQFSSVNGDLIIVNPFTNPLSVRYSVGEDDISVTEITIQIRDIRGLDDTLSINERTTSTKANLISSQPLHYYNLLNQGWFDDALDQWDTARADMPSNADYIALSRASSTDSFDDAILTSLEAPTTLAPRGKFILGLGILDRETAITDAGFTAATLTGTSSSQLVTDMGSFTTIGNFTDSGKAFDGVTTNSASNSASARSTVDDSGLLVFNTDYTLTSTTNMANTARLNDGVLNTTSDNNGSGPDITYDISPDAVVNKVIIREDTDNGVSDHWFDGSFGFSNNPRVNFDTSLSAASVDSEQYVLSEAESQADYTILPPVATLIDTLVLDFQNQSSSLLSGVLKISDVELYGYPTAATDKYIGKDFTATGKKIVSAKIFPSTDEGIHNQALDIGWTAKLYGSASAPANSTDGTLLGTATDTQNTTGTISITSSDTATSFRYVWVNVQIDDVNFIADDSADFIYINELQVFEVSTTPAEEGEITNQRPCCVSTMSSRLFYGGVDTRSLSNTIYFTQVLEDKSKYGKCYQNNDPTSEASSLLLSSDGGEIQINDMGKLYRLMTYEGSLFAFASNGIWRVWNQQGGFDATAFRIDRISDIGTTSPYSFIEVNGIPHWWGEEGIYRMDYNPQFRSFNVVSISDERIKTFFLNIPSENRNFVKGAYDITNNRAIWLYNDAASILDADKYRFDRAICYNTITEAFYPWSFSDSTKIKIKDIKYIRTSNRQDQSKIKFCTTTNNTGLLFSELKDDIFIDWNQLASDISDTSERSSYDAYIETGYRIKGQLMRFHQTNYVLMYMQEHATATNSGFLRGYFDWANASSESKWSSSQQLYNSNLTNRDVNYRRLKVRGKGRSMQFRITNDPGNYFCVLGWAVKDVGNADI